MNSALIKLESFSAGPGAAVRFTRDAVDQAYRDGFGDGQRSGDENDRKLLAQKLTELAVQLADEEDRRRAVRAEAVQALTPILSEILESMAPSDQSKRLEDALTAELARLAQLAAPVHCRIDCPADLREMVDRCIAEAGLTSFDLNESGGDRITLSLQGGRIEFDKAAIATGIRDLIAEIKETKK